MKPLWLPPDAGIKGMNHHAHLFYVLGMFCLHACLCNTYIFGAFEGQKSVRTPGTGVTSCEPSFQCWELNPSTLGAASASNLSHLCSPWRSF